MGASRRFGRVVLNDGSPAVADGTPETGAVVVAAMLRAVAGHTRADGRVDDRALRASPAYAEARTQAARLRAMDLRALDERQVRLAFWINVYNALVLHGIVALGLRRSVWEAWNFFGRVSYRIGGVVLSADEIEHGILRGNRRRVFPPWAPFRAGDPRRALACEPVDPRLHCAINCGASACPAVRVYRPAALDEQLDLAARSFVNQDVVLDRGGRIACSKIFRWYRSDFERAGGIRAFIERHVEDGPVKSALAADRSPCQSFLPYSWALAHPPIDRSPC